MKKHATDSASELNILFIGNSFTARNNVPELTAQIAAARGRKLEHRLISAGGASLRMHWNKAEAQRVLTATPFDFVVLQEQSTLPVKNAIRMRESIRLFDDAIRSAGSKTVLYMTWSRQLEPQNQKLITDAYDAIGAELGAIVVPVGVAWQQALAKHPDLNLYDKDGSHPSLAGSYLAACVFFSVLYNENPVGINADFTGLNAKELSALQKVAWHVTSSQRKTISTTR
ncbi:MAG: hypothetical protein QOH96_3440 [Blastocatellia bacterium]|jgi:hypothetical protein|nr:hypothetical protein [Blastocatellia bacterium]